MAWCGGGVVGGWGGGCGGGVCRLVKWLGALAWYNGLM